MLQYCFGVQLAGVLVQDNIQWPGLLLCLLVVNVDAFFCWALFLESLWALFVLAQIIYFVCTPPFVVLVYLANVCVVKLMR